MKGTQDSLKLPQLELSRDKKHLVVVGGGIAGCMTSLKFLNEGWDVTLIEKENELLVGTSNKTPGRLGLGFHYPDLETSQRLMKATLNFMNIFNDFEFMDINDKLNPIYHGRYYITHNSQVSSDQMRKHYKKLQDIYQRIVSQNSNRAKTALKYFGRPEEFCRELSLKDYKDEINPKFVAAAFETNEFSINWSKLRAHILNKLNLFIHKDQLRVHFNKSLRRNSLREDGRFQLTFESRENSTDTAPNIAGISVSYWVNCTWQNSESFDAELGFISSINLNRSNRLKGLIEVKLPQQLQGMHSSFFAIGDFCMVTNQGNGTAKMTYAPISNLKNFDSITIPNYWSTLLSRKYNDFESMPKELKYIAIKILKGVSKFIPKMRDASIISLNFGIVKTNGEIDIKNQNSSHHKRKESGVKYYNKIGHVTNDAMKLVYGPDNANEVFDIISENYNYLNK